MPPDEETLLNLSEGNVIYIYMPHSIHTVCIIEPLQSNFWLNEWVCDGPGRRRPIFFFSGGSGTVKNGRSEGERAEKWQKMRRTNPAATAAAWLATG